MKPIPILLVALALVSSCGQHALKSDLKITNGLIIDDTQFPSVVHLFRKVYVNGQRKGAALCTGTWIAENLILTAAHCTGDGVSDENGLVQDLEMFVINITDHKASPKTTELVATVEKAWRIKDWEKQKKSNPYDLAILETNLRSDGAPVRHLSKISQSVAVAGQAVGLVGFGFFDMGQWSKKGDDHKRFGKNTIDRIAGGFIEISGEKKDVNGGANGIDSNAGEGDSGGPLFNDDNELIGVASAGGTSGIFGQGVSSYVDIHSDSSQEFIHQFID